MPVVQTKPRRFILSDGMSKLRSQNDPDICHDKSETADAALTRIQRRKTLAAHIFK